FQAAQRLHHDDATGELLTMAMVAQAKAVADAKGAEAAAKLQKQLDWEKQQRLKAEAEAKLNREKYELALKLAQEALAKRDYDVAHAHYTEAGKYYKTDAVLNGIKLVAQMREQAKIAAQEAAQKQKEKEQREANFKKLLAEGNLALGAKDYATAVDKFTVA